MKRFIGVRRDAKYRAHTEGVPVPSPIASMSVRSGHDETGDLSR